MKQSPSMDKWIEDAKKHHNASQVGMYLFHNGVVRETPKAMVRQNINDIPLIQGMEFSYDEKKVNELVEKTYELPGIYYVRVWLNEGSLQVGDDIMYVLIGGDIRPNVIDALQSLVEKIKTQCVVETEIN